MLTFICQLFTYLGGLLQTIARLASANVQNQLCDADVPEKEADDEHELGAFQLS